MTRQLVSLLAGSAFTIVLAGIVAGACQGDGPSPLEATEPLGEIAEYCAVAGAPGLESWVRDLVTVCTPGEDDETVRCTASRVRGDATLERLTLTGIDLLRALPASGGRLVLLLDDSRLVLTAGDGTIERELASWASDPWISDDGNRVAWIGLPDGAETWDFGVPVVVAAQSLSETERTVLAQDELASAPRPVPGSTDVLYVSAQSGLTSFWIAGPDRPASQLTNVGLDDVGEDSVPVAEAQLSWTAAGELIFAALGEGDGEGEPDGLVDETEVAELWRLDPLAGEVYPVGPGAWPRLRDNGTILALQPEGADPCGAVYTEGGAP